MPNRTPEEENLSETGAPPPTSSDDEDEIQAAANSAEILKRLEELENKKYEEKRPWFKSAGILISIVAVALSVFSTTWTIYQESASDFRSKREEIRGMILKMIEYELKNGEIKSDDGFRLNQQIEVLLSAVLDIENEIPNSLSFDEYIVLGDMESLYGQYEHAESHYLKAIPKARSDLERAMSLGRLGDNALIVSAHRDIKKSHRYLDKSIEILRSHDTDPYKHNLVRGLLSKAEAFAVEGDSSSATMTLKEAVRVRKTIKDKGWKADTLEYIEETIKERGFNRKELGL